MKKTPLVPAIAALCLFISSCCKDRLTPPGEISPYQLKTFSLVATYGDSNEYDTLSFKYDSYGNPTSITRPYPGTGHPNFVFSYDNAHRLTKLVGAYTNPAEFEFIHKYFYNTARQITLDSVYTLVEILNGQTNVYGEIYAHYLKYDHEDRIIVDSSTEDVRYTGVGSTTTYSYDGRGNLANGATYDNKTNWHRTNLVWMFLDRNYSQNNPFTAASYNAGGLPLKFTSDPQDNVLFQTDFYSQASLTYEHR